jgi:hypothetical protein
MPRNNAVHPCDVNLKIEYFKTRILLSDAAIFCASWLLDKRKNYLKH